MISIPAIARICHEANRTFCEITGDFSQVAWEYTPLDIQRSKIDGVAFRMKNPQASVAELHENWRKGKEAAGWKHGPQKDTEAKTHPCMVPYDQLPLEQQIKDNLFAAIADVFRAKG